MQNQSNLKFQSPLKLRDHSLFMTGGQRICGGGGSIFVIEINMMNGGVHNVPHHLQKIIFKWLINLQFANTREEYKIMD